MPSFSQSQSPERPYIDFNSYLKAKFGYRVHKISVDAGFTCPNRDGSIGFGGCIYCNQKGSGTGQFKLGKSIREQLVEPMERLKKRFKAKGFIAYFQSHTNTYGPPEKLKEIYDEALSVDEIVGLSIGTRPDCVSDPVLDLIEDYSKKTMVWLEYGLQSARNDTLKLINRGHDAACFKDAVLRTKKKGILTCGHVILGLPYETEKHMLETADFIAELGLDAVKIHMLYVVKNTKLASLYQKGLFRCLDQEQYVDIVCRFLRHLPKDMIIQRITGDPKPDELIAPLWALGAKHETIALIHQKLAENPL